MAKRGRPTKEEREYKGKSYGFMNMPKAAERDGTIFRASKEKHDFKFDDYSTLYTSIYKYLNWGAFNAPFGMIIKNCSIFEEHMAEELMLYSRYDDKYRKALANYLAELFRDTLKEYENKFEAKNMKNIAYKLTLELDMRRYANNLSVIYQIVNDIHYNFFKDHLACYILNGQPDINIPYYTLTIYISNVSVKQKGYLSPTMAYGFDTIKDGVRDIIDKDMSFFTNKGKSDVHIVPMFTDTTAYNHYKEKPAGISYKDWYKQLYGEEFLITAGSNNVLTKLK